MKWTTYNLYELCEINIGRTPSRNVSAFWGKGEPWVSIADLKGRVINTTKEQITAKAIKECKCPLVTKGTLLLSFKLSIGKLAFAGADLYTNEAIAALPIRDYNKIDADYLFYVLRFLPLSSGNNAAKGETMNKKSLAQVKVPVPDNLIAQRQIAHLLSRAEELIATRQRSLALLDDFLKSTFLNLFGDPVENEKGWDVEKLGTVISNIVAGDSYGGEERPLLENELGVLKISAVTSGVFKPDEFKAVPKRLIKKPVVFPRKGDVLFSRANTRELVGAICIVDKDYENVFLPDKLWRIDFKEQECQPTYFKYLFAQERFKNKLTSIASGTSGSMLNISMEKLRAFSIPLPLPALQTQFATIVNQVEVLKTQQRESLAQLQNLYQSLLQRAFAGELDVRNVVLPEENVAAVEANVIEPAKVAQQIPYFNIASDVLREVFSEENMVKALKEAAWSMASSAIGAVVKYAVNKSPAKAQVLPIENRKTIEPPINEATSDEQLWADWRNRLEKPEWTFDALIKAYGEFVSYKFLQDKVFQALQTGQLIQQFNDGTEKETEPQLRERITLKLTT